MSTTALTEAAMLGAVMVSIPSRLLSSPLLSLIIPLPVIVLVVRRGLRTGIITTIVTSLIMDFFDPLLVIVILFEIGVVGIALGQAIRESFSQYYLGFGYCRSLGGQSVAAGGFFLPA